MRLEAISHQKIGFSRENPRDVLCIKLELFRAFIQYTRVSDILIMDP